MPLSCTCHLTPRIEDGADDTTLKTTQRPNKMSHSHQYQKQTVFELPPSISFDFSEGVSVSPETSQRPEMLEFAKDIKSVTVHEDPMPFCGDTAQVTPWNSQQCYLIP